MSMLRLLVSDSDLTRLREIYTKLRHATWRDWLFHASTYISLVAEAVAIIERIVLQSGTPVPGPSDTLVP